MREFIIPPSNTSTAKNKRPKIIDKKDEEASFSKDARKHILECSKKRGSYASGGHSYRAIETLQQAGVDVIVDQVLSNGVAVAHIQGAPSAKRGKPGGQTFFPKSWSDNAILLAGKTVYDKNAARIVHSGVHLYEASVNGVAVQIRVKEGEIEPCYPLPLLPRDLRNNHENL